MSHILHFFQGTKNLFNGHDSTNFNDDIKEVRKKLAEFFNVKNVHFLLGSGTSNGAIPTMKELFDKTKVAIQKKGGDELALFNKFASDFAEKNIENILGALYSSRTFNTSIGETNHIVDSLIDMVEDEIFSEINIDFSLDKSKTILEYYRSFYQRVVLRNKDLSRINVFTTNNDLFNEHALDSLSLNYINGFSGGLSKYFNPGLFNYTFSKRMDTNIEKFEPVEGMVYLYKIHGSINWIEEDDSSKNNYFNIKEVMSPLKGHNNVLIYPNPLKQNKSLGSPYSDLFREFQKKILEPHSVLFVIGYSFSDEHVNNIIYQALATNSSLNIVIFNELSHKEISKIDDNRIFRIFGEDSNEKIHYFKYLASNLIPDLNTFKSTSVLEQFLESLKSLK